MKAMIMWGLVIYYLLTGLYIAILPFVFYENAPGVIDTGPYNMHFVRDVGFAFTVSALGLAWGLRHKLKPLILFGTAWLAIHGLFHFVLWLMHDHPTSDTAIIDVVLVVIPAVVLTYLALSYEPPDQASKDI